MLAAAAALTQGDLRGSDNSPRTPSCVGKVEARNTLFFCCRCNFRKICANGDVVASAASHHLASSGLASTPLPRTPSLSLGGEERNLPPARLSTEARRELENQQRVCGAVVHGETERGNTKRRKPQLYCCFIIKDPR